MKHAAKLHFDLTKKLLFKLAYEYTKANDLKILPSWEINKLAGTFWYRLLRKRFCDLMIWKPEATSLSQGTSFDKENVGAFFSNLKSEMEKHKFPPNRIYNLDERGKLNRAYTTKSYLWYKNKTAWFIYFSERGINVTTISAINAIGNRVPLILIFTRINYKDHMIIGAPTGTVSGAKTFKWSNEIVFVQYLKHFIEHTKPSVDSPLMILYNHETHISIETITLAKNIRIIMLMTLPLHISHRLQPLDCRVFCPIKHFTMLHLMNGSFRTLVSLLLYMTSQV